MTLKRVPNWIAASLFFLTGSIMFALPAVLRSLMYIATDGRAQFPLSPVETMLVAPGDLNFFGWLGMVLTVLALVVGTRPGKPHMPQLEPPQT